MKKTRVIQNKTHSKMEAEILAQKIKDKIQDDPKKAATILTSWIHSLKKSTKKKKSS